VPSDVERLEEALAVALTGRDVTIDLREVEKLGPEGIAALSRASAILDGWDSGLLYLLVTRASPVWQELVRPLWRLRRGLTSTRSDRSDGSADSAGSCMRG
jgi:hypothetical protein